MRVQLCITLAISAYTMNLYQMFDFQNAKIASPLVVRPRARGSRSTFAGAYAHYADSYVAFCPRILAVSGLLSCIPAMQTLAKLLWARYNCHHFGSSDQNRGVFKGGRTGAPPPP